MNKFDAKVDDILQEFVGGLIKGVGSVAKGTGEGIAAFNKTLTDPTAIAQYWKGGDSSKDSKKANPYAYSQSKDSSEGDILVWAKNTQYKAKVVKKLDSSGNFGIAPIGPNNTPANYVFVKTVNDPNKWIIGNNTDVNLNYMTYKSVAIAKENKVFQICPQQSVNNKLVGVSYITVGNTKTDMDQWISEKYYNSQKNQQKPQTTPTPAPASSSNPSTPATPRTPRSPRRNNQQSNP